LSHKARNTSLHAQSSRLLALTNWSAKKVFSVRIFLNYRKNASVTANSHHGKTLQTRALQRPYAQGNSDGPVTDIVVNRSDQWS